MLYNTLRFIFVFIVISVINNGNNWVVSNYQDALAKQLWIIIIAIGGLAVFEGVRDFFEGVVEGFIRGLKK